MVSGQTASIWDQKKRDIALKKAWVIKGIHDLSYSPVEKQSSSSFIFKQEFRKETTEPPKKQVRFQQNKVIKPNFSMLGI